MGTLCKGPSPVLIKHGWSQGTRDRATHIPGPPPASRALEVPVRIVVVVFLSFAFLGSSPALAEPVSAEAPPHAGAPAPAMEGCSVVEVDCYAVSLVAAGATLAVFAAIFAFRKAPNWQTGAVLSAAYLLWAGALLIAQECFCDGKFEGIDLEAEIDCEA